MRCAFCSAELPAPVTGALDTLYAVCPSGCDGAGRFNVACPSCGHVVATFDIPLGYDAEMLAERVRLPFESPWLPETEPTLDVGVSDFLLQVDGQVVTATVIGKTAEYSRWKIEYK